MMNNNFQAAVHTLCKRTPISSLIAIVDALRVLREDIDIHGAIDCLPVNTSSLRGLIEEVVNTSRQLSWRELAIYLEAAASTYHKVTNDQFVEIVWTGPEISLPTRRTEQVVLDVINSSNRNILLATFAAYKCEYLILALKSAIDRNVEISLLLESCSDSQNQLTHDAKNAFSEVSENIQIYYWPIENRPRNPSGHPAKMHAKFILSENLLFVSSSNMTSDALERNIEVGSLIKNSEIIQKMWDYFYALIKSKIIQKI